MESAVKYLAIGFAAIFTIKMIWLGYLAITGREPKTDDMGDASGWGD